MSHAPNRLGNEKSPYLLQHALNPVDWFPWGNEAFEKARSEDKPIFLSIGYSTCHWCHVMERESFENDEIAAVLNAHFVPVKLDREERPDIDRVYMTAMQMMGLGGGWPLNVFLAPDLTPFYGGTYFPPQSTRGRIGMLDLLPRVAGAWREQREQVLAQGAQVIEGLKSLSTRAGEAGGDRGVLIERAYDSYWRGARMMVMAASAASPSSRSPPTSRSCSAATRATPSCIAKRSIWPCANSMPCV